MKPNMGTVDRVIRFLIAIVLIVLYYQGFINGTVAFILLALAGIFILTSFVNFCPLYLPFGISTRKKPG